MLGGVVISPVMGLRIEVSSLVAATSCPARPVWAP